MKRIRARVGVLAVSVGLVFANLPATAANAASYISTCGAVFLSSTTGGGWCDGNGPNWTYAGGVQCNAGGRSYRYFGPTRWAGDRSGSYKSCPAGWTPEYAFVNAYYDGVFKFTGDIQEI